MTKARAFWATASAWVHTAYPGWCSMHISAWVGGLTLGVSEVIFPLGSMLANEHTPAGPPGADFKTLVASGVDEVVSLWPTCLLTAKAPNRSLSAASRSILCCSCCLVTPGSAIAWAGSALGGSRSSKSGTPGPDASCLYMRGVQVSGSWSE